MVLGLPSNSSIVRPYSLVNLFQLCLKIPSPILYPSLDSRGLHDTQVSPFSTITFYILSDTGLTIFRTSDTTLQIRNEKHCSILVDFRIYSFAGQIKNQRLSTYVLFVITLPRSSWEISTLDFWRSPLYWSRTWFRSVIRNTSPRSKFLTNLLTIVQNLSDTPSCLHRLRKVQEVDLVTPKTDIDFMGYVVLLLWQGTPTLPLSQDRIQWKWTLEFHV